MAKLIVLSGVPGSGKSYFARLLKKAKGSHVFIVSSDELRNMVGGSPQNFEFESVVWKMFYELPKLYAIDNDALVVLDATQIIKKYRTDAVKCLRTFFDDIDLVVFQIDKALVNFQNLQREWAVPQDVLDKFYSDFTLPDAEEIAFFDQTFFIKQITDFASVIDAL